MKHKSILLTSMRSPYLDSDRVYPPLGILYLKSYLNRFGIEVGLEDEFDFQNPQKYEKYDVLGASVMTPQREASLEFLNFCKKHWPTKPVVIGGPHAKHYFEDVEKEEWDYIVPLDGQRAALKIMKGEAQRVERDFIQKYDWENIDVPDRKSNEAKELLRKYNYSLGGVRSTTMLTALGCPELCFPKNTKVIVSNGINKKIQEVVLGDKLLAFDKGQIVETTVNKLVRNSTDLFYKIYFEDNSSIQCTEEHPFHVQGNWIRAKDLIIGQEITSISFKDKISFYAKNNNCVFDPKIQAKISKTVSRRHKEGFFPNQFYKNHNLEKYHLKYTNSEKWELQKKNLSERMIKDNPMKNLETAKKMSKTIREKIKNGKITPFMCTQKFWDKMEISPNKSEKFLQSFLNEHFPDEWKFVGDGSVRFGYYSPDFINTNGKKKIIEFQGCYWHGCEKCFPGNKRNQKRDVDRIKMFESFGFKTLQIWTHDLKDKNLLLEKIGNFIYNGLKIIKIKKIQLKDTIPVFNFECFPYNNYFVRGAWKGSNYILSHNCSFCEDARTAVRWSSIENIKQQLDHIVELGYKGVYIFDDLFAIALKKITPICYELKKRGIIYRCNGQARYFNEDFAKLLSETGCYEIAFGAESGSQKILDNIQKRTTVEMNYKFVELCKKYGIICKAFLMIGLPGETYETIAQTEKFIKDMGLDDFQLSIYYPYKGTKLRDDIDKGKNNFDLEFEGEGLGAYGQKGGSTESVIRTNALSSKELLAERDRLVKTYKPVSHTNKWETQLDTDHFFDQHLKSNTEYKG